ncbi:MAG: hypothetical protein ACJ8F7_12415 [Gemmataceae bacterium]
MFRNTLRRLGFAVVALGAALFLFPLPGYAGGGGGGGNVETIRVNHCEYAAVAPGYVELLISASDSNGAALYAYLPNGQLLGQVFAGGQYGGSVFLTGFVPNTITIVSSTGAHVTVPCDPFQP